MKAVVAAFNQEKALVGAFFVITNLRMELFEALADTHPTDSRDTETIGDRGKTGQLVIGLVYASPSIFNPHGTCVSISCVH